MSPFLYALLVFGSLSLAIPIVLVFGIRGMDIRYVAVLPVLVLFYSSIRLSQLAYIGRPRFFSLTFWMFVYCFFGIVPLLQFLSGEYSLKGSYSSYQLALAMGIVVVGIWAFEVGQFLERIPRIRARSRRFFKPISDREISFGGLAVLFVVGLCTVGIAMFVFGPLQYLFSSRTEVFDYFATLPGPGLVTLLLASSAVQVPILVAAIAFLALLVHKRRFVPERYAYIQPFGVLLGWMAIAVGLLANNPINSPRYLIGSMFLALVFVVASARWRPWHMSVGIVALAVALLVVFPISDLFRYSTTDPLIYRMSLESIAHNLTSKGDFDAFQQLANVVVYVDANGFSFGRQMLGALLFFAPRTFWPDKPESTGMAVGSWMSYDFTNLSCPLWGEFYFDIGIPGVIVGFIVYGWISRTLEEVNIQKHQNGGSAFGDGALATIAAYQTFVLRGSLLPAFAYLFPILVALWIVSTPHRTSRKGNRLSQVVVP